MSATLTKSLASALSAVTALCLGLMVVGLVAPAPLAAQDGTQVRRFLDNVLDDFARGTLARTSVAQEAGTNVDADGLVQLGLIGVMSNTRTVPAGDLPRGLSHLGATNIGNRIYIFGGLTAGGDQETSAAVSEIWSGAINTAPQDDGDPANGREMIACTAGSPVISETAQISEGMAIGTCFNAWRFEGTMPAVKGERFGDPISRTHSMAVATVDNPTGDDYIYLLGGAGGASDLSQYTVRIATINDQGQITAWRHSEEAVILDSEETFPLRIPRSEEEIQQRGLLAAGVASVQLGDTWYLYLVGGLERYVPADSQQILEGGSKSVFYARVGADGLLYRPGTSGDTPENLGWTRATNANNQNADIPIPIDINGDTGLSNGAVVATQLEGAGTALYTIGGQYLPSINNNPAEYSPRIYRGVISPDGSLDWSGWQGVMGRTLDNHAAVEFNGKVYATGGRTGDDIPVQFAMVSYVEDSLELHNFGTEQGPQHVKVDSDLETLPSAIAFHASVVITDSVSTGFVYVIGGRCRANDPRCRANQDRSNEMFIGRITPNTLADPDFIGDGRYTSQVHTLTDVGDAPQIEEIIWTANIPRDTEGPMDIQMQYRVANPSDCSNPGWSEADWRNIFHNPGGITQTQHATRNGENIYTVPFSMTNGERVSEVVRCIQYRANFTTSAAKASPTLQSVEVRIYSADSPDLRVNALDVITDAGRLDRLNLELINRYTEDQRTLDAAAEGPGTFFVDLFIFRAGEDVPTEPSLPFSPSSPLKPVLSADNDINDGGLGIKKESLPANDTLPIVTWCAPPFGTSCTQKPVADLFRTTDTFTQSGVYTFCVGVDAFVNDLAANPMGLVNETLPGAEANNWQCTAAFIEVSEVVVTPTPTPSPTPSPTPAPPTLTLKLETSPVITEGTGVESEIAILVAGTITEMITVTFTLSDTATMPNPALLAADYILLNGTQRVTDSLQMTANTTRTLLRLQTVDDEEVEAPEQVTLKLTQHQQEHYRLSSTDSTSATITLLDNDEEIPTVYMPIIILR